MAIFNHQIEFSKEKLINHYSRRNSLTDFLYGIARLLGIIVQNIYCISSYLILTWIILPPIGWLRVDLGQRVENYLYNSLLYIVSSWSLAAGATVVEAGDEYKYLVEESENCYQKTNINCSRIANSPNGYCDGAGDQTRHRQNYLEDEASKRNLGCSLLTSSSNAQSSPLENNRSPSSEERPSEQKVAPKSDLISSSDCREISSSDRSNVNFSGKDCNNVRHRDVSIGNTEKDAIKDKLQGDHPSSNNDRRFLAHRLKLQQLIDDQKKPKILFLCNHVSTADVPLLMQSFSTLTNQSLLWVLDAQFKPTNFGLVCSSHGDYFLAKNTFATGAIRDHALKYPDRNIYVLFPEGGFLRKRLEGSNRYALKNGLPMTKYVTHPRFGAFKDLIDESLGVTHIVDATLIYDDIRNPLSILDIALGNRKEPAILSHKIYPLSGINPNEEWLRGIWLEKDKLLQQYYEDRSKVYKRLEGTLRAAKQNWFKLLSVHLFYLLVCYLTIFRLFSATSVTMSKARDLYYSNI